MAADDQTRVAAFGPDFVPPGSGDGSLLLDPSTAPGLTEVAPGVLIRDMLPIDRAIDLFMDDLVRRGYSERTRTTYRRILDHLDRHLAIDEDVSKITTDDLRRFLASYAGRKKRGRGSYARGTQAHAECVLSSFFKWLKFNRKIVQNPMDDLPRTKRIPSQDLDVVTVSADDVRRLLASAETWAERIALGILVYTGARRRAVARLRVTDYADGKIKFREKGAKVIVKPVPDELAQLIEAARAAGAYEGKEYLVPEEAFLWREEDRDDRVIWRLVKRVAERAGVETQTHALRAAFACFYLESHPGDVEALQQLMGHRSIATTQTYLRRLDRDQAMERVRDMSWGVALS